MHQIDTSRWKPIDPDTLMHALLEYLHLLANGHVTALSVALSNYIAEIMGPGEDQDWITQHSKTMRRFLTYVETTIVSSDFGPVFVAKFIDENKGIIEMEAVDSRYCVSVSLIDVVGFANYQEVFLTPVKLIHESKLSAEDKLRLISLIEQGIVNMFDEICLNEPTIDVRVEEVRTTKLLLGSLDFSCGYTMFSDVLHYHMKHMALNYCLALKKYKIGGFEDGKFYTNFAIKNFSLVNGTLILIHLED